MCFSWCTLHLYDLTTGGFSASRPSWYLPLLIHTQSHIPALSTHSPQQPHQCGSVVMFHFSTFDWVMFFFCLLLLLVVKDSFFKFCYMHVLCSIGKAVCCVWHTPLSSSVWRNRWRFETAFLSDCRNDSGAISLSKIKSFLQLSTWGDSWYKRLITGFPARIEILGSLNKVSNTNYT